MSDDIDRAELRRLHAAATPGPWETEAANGGVFHVAVHPFPEGSVALDAEQADAELIAKFRTAVPALLDALEQAERERDCAREEIRWLRHQPRPLTTVDIDDDMVERFRGTFYQESGVHLKKATVWQSMTAALTEPPSRPEWADARAVFAHVGAQPGEMTRARDAALTEQIARALDPHAWEKRDMWSGDEDFTRLFLDSIVIRSTQQADAVLPIIRAAQEKAWDDCADRIQIDGGHESALTDHLREHNPYRTEQNDGR